MSEWIESPLAELANIVSGGTPSRDVSAYWGGEIPWVTPTDITGCRTNYLEQTQDTITKQGLLASSAKLLPAGTILLTSRASIGLSKIASVPVSTNQGFKSLTPKHGINGTFLFYQTQRIRGAFERFAAGSTFLEINKKDTERILLLHPTDPVEQKKIATILTGIDTAIEKTEALIAKYQQIKAGLMHDLFTRGVLPNGQLRPPREQAPELYQETAIGWIPREWRIDPLGKLLTTPPKNGYSPREVDSWQGLYVLGLGCLTSDGFEAKQLKNAPRNAAIDSGALLVDGDFLISRANTPELVGLCGTFKDLGSPAIYPDLMMRLKLVDTLNADFLEAQLLMPATRKRLTALAVGTSASMAKLNSKSVQQLFIAVPDSAEQKAIVGKLCKVADCIRTYKSEKLKLNSQKQGLMHDLLTGQVPVIIENRTTTTEAVA